MPAPFVQQASELARVPLRLQRRVAALLRRARLGRREEAFATPYAYGDWGRIQSQPPIDAVHSYRSADGVEEYRLVRHRSARLRGEAATRREHACGR